MRCLVARFDGQSVLYPLPRAEARLGSSSSNDIRIPFPGVSRAHALLVPTADGFLIRDTGSKNRLFVGDQRVEEVALSAGVPVQMGRAFLTIEDVSTSDVEIGLALPRRSDSSGVASRETGSESGNGAPALAALRFMRQIELAGKRRIRRDLQSWMAAAHEAMHADALVLLQIDQANEAILASAGNLPSDALIDRIASAVQLDRKPQPSALRVLLDRTVLTARTPGRGRIRCLAAMLQQPPDSLEGWQRDLFEFAARKFLDIEEPQESEALPEQAGELKIPEGMVIGESAAMRNLLGQIKATIRSRMDVLLWGETGTGKELFARMIHASGPTASGPFVAINCAAIPSELLESELFGVQGRVATGVDPHPGLFVQADGGSIFLDEIGELAEPLQAKLLRVLQEREVLPLGATAPRKIEARVIASSNRDLLKRTEEGRFRADLYYRLRGLQFHIPPLRDRREDIVPLLLAFATRAADSYSRRIGGVSRKAVHLLAEHDWPGNVRELKSEVERAVLVCPPGSTLQADHFGAIKWAAQRKSARPPVETPNLAATREAVGESQQLTQRIDAVEREAIQEALVAARGNKSLAARMLGISRNGLAIKMRRLKLTWI